MPPIRRPPSSAVAGAYGDSEPSGSSSGPSRLPIRAPAAKPASVSTPTTSPWRQPSGISSTAKATIAQSIGVTGYPLLAGG